MSAGQPTGKTVKISLLPCETPAALHNGTVIRRLSLLAALVLAGSALVAPVPERVELVALPLFATGPDQDGARTGRLGHVATDPRCADGAGTWLGTRWTSPYRWWFNASSVPAYLGGPDRAREAARTAARNLDDGRNECGIGGGLAVSQRHLGDTTRAPGVGADGGCGSRDGRNVIAFGELPGGLLALSCLWWVRGRGDGRTIEADIRISTTADLFTFDPTAGCGERWDLEGTLTHEFGHVFGLGHVPFAEHGTLTMSDGLPSCTARFRSLGLGDLMTLRRHYN